MQDFDPAKVRTHRLEQAEAVFPLLRGCPNTAAIARLAFLDSLGDADRIAFSNQLSDFDAAERTTEMKHIDEAKKLLMGFPLVEAFLGQAGTRSPSRGLAFMPVKAYAGVCKDAGVGGFDGFARMVGMSDDAKTPASAHAAARDDLVPVAPRRLRKLIDDAMTTRFGAAAEHIASDHTRYRAPLPGGGFLIDAMFPRGMGKMHQFEYVFSARMENGRSVWTKSYEGVWRTMSRWDYLTEGNAERGVAHVVRLVEACVRLI